MSPNWFIGFPVEAEPWYNKVVTSVPAGIKVFKPADLHITLAFLGSVGKERALASWQVVMETAFKPVSCTLGPMAPFGNPSRPSAYAFTLDQGREEIVGYMQQHTDVLLEVAGQKKEERAPRPHITIARPPRNATDALRAEGLHWAEQVTPPAELLMINQIALFTWADDRKSRQFKIVLKKERITEKRSSA